MVFDESKMGLRHEETGSAHETGTESKGEKKAEDRALVKRCLAKDSRAWDAFFKKFDTVLRTAITLKLAIADKREDVIDDILQETRLSITRSLNKWDAEKGNLKDWLFILATRRTVDWIRSAHETRAKKRAAGQGREWHRKEFPLHESKAVHTVRDPAVDSERVTADRDLLEKFDTLAKGVLTPRELLLWQKAIKEQRTLKNIGDEIGITESGTSIAVRKMQEKLVKAARKAWRSDIAQA